MVYTYGGRVVCVWAGLVNLTRLCQLRVAPHGDGAVGNPGHRAAARIGRRATTCLDRRQVDKV